MTRGNRREMRFPEGTKPDLSARRTGHSGRHPERSGRGRFVIFFLFYDNQDFRECVRYLLSQICGTLSLDRDPNTEVAYGFSEALSTEQQSCGRRSQFLRVEATNLNVMLIDSGAGGDTE
jgi:hypothetical protein